MELALVQSALMPPQVVVAAEQHQIFDAGLAAVFSVLEVVGVAERWGPGAASGGAAAVSGLECPALVFGDRLVQRFEAADLSGRVE